MTDKIPILTREIAARIERILISEGWDTAESDRENLDALAAIADGDAVCVTSGDILEAQGANEQLNLWNKRLKQQVRDLRDSLLAVQGHIGVPQENRDRSWHADGNRIYRLVERVLEETSR